MNRVFIIVPCLFLAGCLEQPKYVSVAEACGNPDLAGMIKAGNYEGYRAYEDCTRRVDVENDRRLQAWDDQVAGLSAMSASQPAYRPAVPHYTLDTQPPDAPMPAPVTSQTTAAPARTWMDTPYAALVPPALRGEPIDCSDPAIPPAARAACN